MIESVPKRLSATAVPVPPDGPVSIEEEAVTVASSLRAAVGALIRALPARVSGATDLDRELKLGYTVSWRLNAFATAENPVGALEQLPGRPTIERLVKAATSKGVASSLGERVLDAYGQYEAFLAEHAGDRTTLASLAGGIAGESTTGRLARRRSAVKSNADLWGVQARTTLLCAIIHPDADKLGFDCVFLSGFSQIHALRRNVPLRLLTRSGAYDSRADAIAAQTPFLAPDESRILEDFSSRPLPRIDTSVVPGGMLESVLRFENIGKASAIDIFSARVVRNTGRGAPQPWHGTTKTVTVPCEALLLDLLVPRGLTDPATVRPSTHGNPALLESLVQRVPDFELPIPETANYLGTGIGTMESPDVPRYSDMVRSVIADLNWTSTTFDIFRCRVRYPIMHTLIHMRVDTVKP